jgi:hypothetical protein
MDSGSCRSSDAVDAFDSYTVDTSGRWAYRGSKSELSMLLVGIGILCVVGFSIYSAHQDICLSQAMDAKYECGISQMLLIAVSLWSVLVALSQIRFVIAACAAVK